MDHTETDLGVTNLGWSDGIAATLVTAIVAEFAGAVSAALLTLDLETVGMGLLVPTFLLPSVLGYVVCHSRRSLARWSAWAFFIPGFAVLAVFMLGWLLGGEGSEMGLYIAVVLLASATAAYVTLRWAIRRKWRTNGP